MPTTDIVTVGVSTALTASGLLGRDCAMPITRITKRMGTDEVLMNMPVFLGYWEDNTTLPVELGQAIDIDTSVVADDCDVAVVDADLTEGELIAPNMRKIKLASKVMQVDQLIPAFCRQRRILQRELGLILNPDGTINAGNEYAVDFARFALATVSKAMAQLLAQRIMRGDESEEFGIDGLYTQFTNGWAQGTPTVPSYLNEALVIDWGALTDATGPTTPDDVTAAGKTISLWGEIVDVPAGINLAELIEDFLIPAIEVHWTDSEGGVSAWEFHVPPGQKRCMLNTAACIRPCSGMNIDFDADLRALLSNLRARDVVRLFPSGREIPMWESPHVEDNVMWFGPRAVGGSPTYGVVFQDMNELFSAIGVLGSTYGQGNGYFNADEPLLTDYRDGMEGPFEARAVHNDIHKVSIDCVQASLMVKAGVLAVARHLWVKFTNVTCATFVTNVNSGVTIDGEAIEGEPPAVPTLTSPADGATVADATPDLTWSAVTGAASYDVQIASDSGFATIVQLETGVTTTTLTVDTLAEGTYYWRVRSVDIDGPSAWSTARSLIIDLP